MAGAFTRANACRAGSISAPIWALAPNVTVPMYYGSIRATAGSSAAASIACAISTTASDPMPGFDLYVRRTIQADEGITIDYG